MVTTCQKNIPSISCIVSLYHAKSNRSINLSAFGGCFHLAQSHAFFIHPVSEAEGATSPGGERAALNLSCLDLTDVIKAWVAGGDSGARDVVWKEPIELTALTCAGGGLSAKWVIALRRPTASKSAAAAAAMLARHSVSDTVCAACYDAVSIGASMPSIRVVSQTLGEIIDVALKPLAKGLSMRVPVIDSERLAFPSSKQAVGNDDADVSKVVPMVHVWSVGKSVFVLTKHGDVYQCSLAGSAVGASAAHVVGCTSLPLPSILLKTTTSSSTTSTAGVAVPAPASSDAGIRGVLSSVSLDTEAAAVAVAVAEGVKTSSSTGFKSHAAVTETAEGSGTVSQENSSASSAEVTQSATPSVAAPVPQTTSSGSAVALAAGASGAATGGNPLARGSRWRKKSVAESDSMVQEAAVAAAIASASSLVHEQAAVEVHGTDPENIAEH
jgi:hypothetical protein